MNKTVKINFVYSAIYQILILILPLVTTPYISRVFGAEQLGIFSYTLTIAQYFILFAMLGLNNYGNRLVAMVRDEKERLDAAFSEIYTMQIITGSISVLLYLVYVILFEDEYQVYSLILVVYILSAVFDINWFFWGLEKFKLTVIRNAVVKLVSVIAIFTLVKTKDDLWIYIFIYAISALVSNGFLWFYVKKEVHFYCPGFRNVMKHLKPNIVMFIPVVAISVYKYMDKIMLGSFSKTEAGYYENVEKIVAIVLGFIISFCNVMLPRISNMVAKREEAEINLIISKSMHFVLGMSFAFAFGLFAIAPEFVIWFFGEEFTQCILILKVMVWSMVFQAWASIIRTQYLIPFKKDKLYILSVITGAVVNFVINYIMIPKYGALGAVIGTIMAEACVAIVQTVAVKNELDIVYLLKQGLPFVLLGGIMYYLVRGVAGISKNLTLTILLEVITGVGVYIILWMICEIIMHKKRFCFKHSGDMSRDI